MSYLRTTGLNNSHSLQDFKSLKFLTLNNIFCQNITCTQLFKNSRLRNCSILSCIMETIVFKHIKYFINSLAFPYLLSNGENAKQLLFSEKIVLLQK